MATSRKTGEGDTSREADYADYEGRDIRDGWPYADGDSAAARKRETGRDSRSLGEDEPADMQVSGETAIDSSGGPDPDPGSELDAIDDDDLEERIYDILSGRDDLDVSTMTVTVHGGRATLSGSVETREQRALAERIVRSLGGVSETSNDLSTIGVGSHIPPDYDE
ncbi:BON domain-containing protein [Hoeflea marina]|uniref:BON domain-containing protein n=1 Tax=Hoeflea marina TaxID=274592 RepID=A0A317PJA5_9HYPH|nr:BON domain-containing protein [Hoeflea marina]PWV99965.1 BON domain-containing protein [Hoeflea marina]